MSNSFMSPLPTVHTGIPSHERPVDGGAEQRPKEGRRENWTSRRRAQQTASPADRKEPQICTVTGAITMAVKNIAVFGIYPDQLTAEDAVDSLKEFRLPKYGYFCIIPRQSGHKDFAHEKHTKAPEGRRCGRKLRRGHRRSLGLACRHRRPCDSRRRAFHRSRSDHGDARWHRSRWSDRRRDGALIGLGIPEYEAKRYEGRIRRGSILLSAHCDDSDWAKRARNILYQTGAEDVASTGEAQADFAMTDKPMRRGGSSDRLRHRAVDVEEEDMAMKNIAAFGIYPDQGTVNDAIESLKGRRIPSDGYIGSFSGKSRLERFRS